MDPATAIFVGAKAIGTFAKGAAGRDQALSDANRMDAEARLADTQALQRDTQLRDELNRFLSGTMAARSANGLSANSPNAMMIFKNANKISSEERTRQTANDRQRAANLRAGASASRRSARRSLLTGVIGAAVPIAQTQI